MVSLSEGHGRQCWCTSCGAWWKKTYLFPEVPESANPEYGFISDPTLPMCEDCIQWWHESGTIVQRFIEPLPGPPAETFCELFKAARVLLREEVADEDQIIPTLMAAHEIDCGLANPSVIPEKHHWLDAKARVIQKELKRPPRTKNLRVVRVVDGILVLEWEPVSAQLVWEPIFSGLVWEGTSQQLEYRSWKEDGSEPLTSRWKSGPPWSESLTDQARPDRPGVLIRVYPYNEKIQAEEVASRYQEVLAAENLLVGRPRNTLIEREATGSGLCLLVASGKRWSGRNVTFPSPRLVERVSEGVLEEFEDRLVMRHAGREMDPDNLVPACVGFFLRASGRMEGRKEVEQLVDKHVLLREMPWKALNSGNYLQIRSKKQQFWDTIQKTVHPKIERLFNNQAF